MKKLLFTLFIFSSSLLALNAQGSWSPRASLPDSSRTCAVGFSIGNYGYVGLGIHSGRVNYPCLDDFWQFNPSANSWTQKANFPGKARICPATFVIGHYAYVVTGQENDSASPRYTTECWQYNADNNTWKQKANFPGSARAYDVGFAIGSKGYVGTGSEYAVDFRKDFWAYDTNTNSWKQIADLPPPTARFSASGFSANGKGYVCFGYDSSKGVQNDIWEYDTGAKTWAQKTSNPGHPQCAAMGFVIHNDIYMGCGTNDIGTDYNQFWVYNTSTDTWKNTLALPGYSRTLGCAFAIGDTGYAGFGEDSTSLYFNDIYRFFPDSVLGLEQISTGNEIKIYPNPFNDYCNIFLFQKEDDKAIITLYDIQGKKVEVNIKRSYNSYVISREGLENGIYILSVGINNQIFYNKLIITN